MYCMIGIYMVGLVFFCCILLANIVDCIEGIGFKVNEKWVMTKILKIIVICVRVRLSWRLL